MLCVYVYIFIYREIDNNATGNKASTNKRDTVKVTAESKTTENMSNTESGYQTIYTVFINANSKILILYSCKPKYILHA